MKRFVAGEDRSQSTLFSERLDDYIAEDNPVRVIDVFVDELDLKGLGFKAVNNRDKNFTDRKLKARMQQLEESITRYLTELDRAGREPALVTEARVEHIKQKIATVKDPQLGGSRLCRVAERSPIVATGQRGRLCWHSVRILTTPHGIAAKQRLGRRLLRPICAIPAIAGARLPSPLRCSWPRTAATATFD